MHRSTPFLASGAVLLLVSSLAACSDDPSGDGDPGSGASSSASGTGGEATGAAGPGGSGTGGDATGGTGTGGAGECGPDTSAPNEELPGTTDPEAGEFTLDEALAGLPPGPGPLRAVITTDLGFVTCELFPEVAPIGVANFVGLARGTRPWKDPVSKKWVKRRFYDGLTFHRVIDDFMAQGGDPLGTGAGGPGYKFANEWGDKTHIPGTLAYANAGPNTNGSQFYITEVTTDHLDGGAYTVFGYCAPLAVIEMLTAVATSGPPNDSPVTPLHMQTVEITRCAIAP
jgi:peptidyl-prolyl cis-trans isomerase A (cyclophilin A)